MAKSRDAAKERYWREVIRRQVASGLGTKRFCAQEGIPEGRFYWWRRTLHQRGRQRARAARDGGAVDSGRDRSSPGDTSAFVPVALPFSVGAPIEVVHPHGHVIRVPAIFDAVALKRILAVLDISSGSCGEE
ncbi:MAG: IS66 family insertion sequence element accessory protein TnpA [Isosphaeraceae bacterium]